MNAIIINFFLAALMFVIMIFLLVFIIDYFRRKKIKNTLLSRLNQTAAYNQAEMDTVAFPGDRVIGIDQKERILIFFNGRHKPEIIDLKDIVYCNINKHFHRRHLRSIQLELMHGNTEKLHLLPFYQKPVDTEFNLTSAMKNAEKWHRIISGCLPGSAPRAQLLN